MCCIIFLFIAAAAVGLGLIIAPYTHIIPPSLPSAALQSFTFLPPPPNATANYSPQNWQLSIYLRNTNDDAVFYDHINARLLLQGTLSHNTSMPFDQPAQNQSVVRLRFPGNGTAAATGSCTAEEADYSGLSPCRTMTFSLEWNARVTTRAPRKPGSVTVVCEDVKVLVSSDTTLIPNGPKECFVRGSWSTVSHVEAMT